MLDHAAGALLPVAAPHLAGLMSMSNSSSSSSTTAVSGELLERVINATAAELKHLVPEALSAIADHDTERLLLSLPFQDLVHEVHNEAARMVLGAPKTITPWGWFFIVLLFLMLVLSVLATVMAFAAERPRLSAGAAEPLAPARDPKVGKYRADTLSLGSLRFFGNLQVVLGHFYEGADHPHGPHEFGGSGAVTMFLVMSGFVMTLAYGRKAERSEDSSPCSAASREFLARRVARLYPVYLLSMALAAAHGWEKSSWVEPPGMRLPLYLTEWVLTLTFLQAIVLCFPYDTFVLGVLWNVSAMVFYYFFFMPLGKRFRLASPRSTLTFTRDAGSAWLAYGVCFALVAIIIEYSGFMPSGYPPDTAWTNPLWYRVAHSWGPPKLFAGVLGSLCAAKALQLGEGVHEADAMTALAHSRKWGLVAMLTLGFFAVNFLFGLFANRILPTPPCILWHQMDIAFVFRIVNELAYVPLYGLLMLALTQSSGGMLARFLSLPPFVFFGDISYCMYCIHMPILSWYKAVRAWCTLGLQWPPPKVQLSGWEFVPYLALSWAASAAAYYFVEKPTREPLAELLCRLFGVRVAPRAAEGAKTEAKPAA